MRTSKIKAYIDSTTEAAPLAAFRFLFGLLMFVSLIRFWANGWIEKLYLDPEFHFSYYGFEWVKPLGSWTYLIFILCMLSSIMVCLGWRYRFAIILFFLSFTYIELMDKTTYLNHYYFISIMSFLMIFLPSSAYFSIEAFRNNTKAFQEIPRWTVDSVKFMLAIVYFYAGLAKLNSDWLFEAMPLKIWLPSQYGLPLIGVLMQKEWIHYAFSWGGAIYDLSIPFLLYINKTRPYAFAAVIFFHVMTRILFPIGMFPFIMVFSTLIFFESGFHKRILSVIARVLNWDFSVFDNGKRLVHSEMAVPRWRTALLSIFFAIQLLFPFRYLLYPGHLFWTEEGFRFSWRVMLMEKAGYAQFKITDEKTGAYFYVNNSDFLSIFQEKQMSTQADFILEYAHYLARHFKSQGHENLGVYVESYVALNGLPSRAFVDPDVNLLNIMPSLKHRNWVLPYHEE